MDNKYIYNTSQPEKFPPRIVVKFHESVNLPYEDGDDITGYLSKNKILPWQQLTEMFPGVTIKRSFTSVEPVVIRKIIERAQLYSSGYHPPNFFCYCTIDCSYDNNEEELLSI